MADVFRITDRIGMDDRNTVYIVRQYFHSVISNNTILYDLHGNGFRVKSYEKKSSKIVFELVDGVEAMGNILLEDPTDIHFLFCSHPLHAKKVDENYKEEYVTASRKYGCALFSYEKLEMGKLVLQGEKITGLTIYRGWMMKPELYRLFYHKLEENGIILINTPEEYERYHCLPKWYDDFKDDTAKSVWEESGSIQSALSLSHGLKGAYIVKDNVKSRKHEWNDACFIHEISDRVNAEKIIRNFVERQGENLVGGIVLRQYEPLKSIGVHEKSGMPLSEEYRVFVYAGKIILADGYWKNDQKPAFRDGEWHWIETQLKKVKSNLMTMDIARREDGKLIIMELGDGQVSGLQQIKPEDFYREIVPTTRMVIMAEEPLGECDIQEMKNRISSIGSVQELVDIYASVHNKFWFIEDELYDYEEGFLLNWEDCGIVKRLDKFMKNYGYYDGNGWWIKK